MNLPYSFNLNPHSTRVWTIASRSETQPIVSHKGLSSASHTALVCHFYFSIYIFCIVLGQAWILAWQFSPRAAYVLPLSCQHVGKQQVCWLLLCTYFPSRRCCMTSTLPLVIMSASLYLLLSCTLISTYHQHILLLWWFDHAFLLGTWDIEVPFFCSWCMSSYLSGNSASHSSSWLSSSSRVSFPFSPNSLMPCLIFNCVIMTCAWSFANCYWLIVACLVSWCILCSAVLVVA